LKVREKLSREVKLKALDLRACFQDISYYSRSSIELGGDQRVRNRVACEQLSEAALTLVSELAGEGIESLEEMSSRLGGALEEKNSGNFEEAQKIVKEESLEEGKGGNGYTRKLKPVRGVLSGIGLAARRLSIPLWHRLRGDFEISHCDEKDPRPEREKEAHDAVKESQLILLALSDKGIGQDQDQDQDQKHDQDQGEFCSEISLPADHPSQSLISAASMAGVPILVLRVDQLGGGSKASIEPVPASISCDLMPRESPIPCQQIFCGGSSLEEVVAEVRRLFGPTDKELRDLRSALGVETIRSLARAQAAPEMEQTSSLTPEEHCGGVGLVLRNASDHLLEALAAAMLRNFRLRPGSVSSLDVTGSMLTSQGLKVLVALATTPPLSGLERLVLAQVSSLGDKTISRLAKASLANLREFEVQGCNKVGDKGLEALAQCCPALRRVDVGRTKVGNLGVVSLSAACPHLVYVGLEACSITDTALTALAKGCGHLEKLQLKQCSAITDYGIEALVQGCPSLALLSLARCLHISEKGLMALERLKELRSLDLSHNMVSLMALLRMTAAHPQLEALYIQDCPGLELAHDSIYEALGGLPRLMTLAAAPMCLDGCMEHIVDGDHKSNRGGRAQVGKDLEIPQRILAAIARAGGCIRWQDSQGNTALHVACTKNLLVSAEAIIKAWSAGSEEEHEQAALGGNLEASNQKGWRPLHCAAHTGTIKIVQRLLSAKVEVNSVDDQGRTALHHACMSGPHNDDHSEHSVIVKLLVKSGANVDAMDHHGRLPLHYACQSTVIPLVKVLLEMGGKLDVADKRGFAPKDLIGNHCPLTEYLAKLEATEAEAELPPADGIGNSMQKASAVPSKGRSRAQTVSVAVVHL